MVLGIIAYFFAGFVVAIILFKKRYGSADFSNLAAKRNGIIFESNKMHKLKIYGAKILVLEQVIFLKKESKVVKIENVQFMWIKKDFVYFRALGEVQIWLKCYKFYKYFEMHICSPKFNLEELKQVALKEMLNNIFNIKNCKAFRRYINIVKNILKIECNEQGIKIEQNNYKLPFVVEYVAKGVTKKVNVNC